MTRSLPGATTTAGPDADGHRPTRGALVCLEGIDGAGKTTAAHRAAALLRAQGRPTAVFDKKALVPDESYVHQQLAALGALIWDHPADDPYLQMGDMYWVHLQAAWYGAASRCLVGPQVTQGRIVVTDTWTQKFLAKLSLRPGVDQAAVRAAFADVTTPDLVIHLVVDPRVAAARKGAFGISEAGNHEGPVALTVDAFVTYQTQLAGVLDQTGSLGGWQRLDVTELTADEVATTVARLIAGHVTPTPQTTVPSPADGGGR